MIISFLWKQVYICYSICLKHNCMYSVNADIGFKWNMPRVSTISWRNSLADIFRKPLVEYTACWLSKQCVNQSAVSKPGGMYRDQQDNCSGLDMCLATARHY